MYFYRRRRFWIPALDGVQQKLTAGTRVADIGCGYVASTLIMAKAFPKSELYSLPGFQTQVLTYLNSGRQASGNDLYIIWIGAMILATVSNRLKRWRTLKMESPVLFKVRIKAFKPIEQARSLLRGKLFDCFLNFRKSTHAL